MGHTEMCLAVAGLGDDEVEALTKRLAGDWSSFGPAEQAAFAFAQKQALDAASVSAADLLQLERECGRTAAWHVIWWSSRCHYMTKIADAFQLPLEEENPFRAMPGVIDHRATEAK